MINKEILKTVPTSHSNINSKINRSPELRMNVIGNFVCDELGIRTQLLINDYNVDPRIASESFINASGRIRKDLLGKNIPINNDWLDFFNFTRDQLDIQTQFLLERGVDETITTDTFIEISETFGRRIRL